MKSLNNISVKEFGATNFLLDANDDIKERFKEIYPDKWRELFIFSVFRLLYNTLIKNLQAYYRLYRLLADNSLLKKFSPGDVLVHLSRVYRLKIQDRWIAAEIPKKTMDTMEKLSIPIT